MFKFTRTGIFCIVIAIMFLMIQIGINRYVIKNEINEDIMQQIQEIPENNNTEEKQIWQIQIPKISLIANIEEGTTKEILNQYVGHFEATSLKEGNIGLAAHNRGYSVNYFKDIKLLKEGDEIIYKFNEFEKAYEVDRCRIIKETEWKYLEETEENMLTLITCVENQPEYRRCIQAIEKN